MRRRRNVAGFTILEMTMVALLVSMVMILAANLMLESSVLSRDAMRPITRTHLGLSEAVLRQDLATGRRVGDSLLWSVEPLVLDVDGRRVVYSVQEGMLRRTEAANGSVRDLSPLHLFLWRSAGDGTWVQMTARHGANDNGGRRFVRWPSSQPDAFFVVPRRPRGLGW